MRVEGQNGAQSVSEFDADGKRRLRRETDASGKTTETHFISPWEEVKDGKLIRYIVHADRRIVRLDEDNGAAVAAPVGPTLDPPVGLHVPWKMSAMLLLMSFFTFFVSGWKRLGHARARGLRWATVGVLALSIAGCGGKKGNGGSDFDLQGTVQTLSAADTLLFTDQLGTLLSETNGLGEVKAEFAALPYGQARHDSSNQTEKYAGAPRDESVGLDQMGARFYSPEAGMWTAPDPVLITDPELLISGEFGTANAYAYSNLNPVIAKDPDGNFWHIVAGAAVGAAVGGAMEAATQYMEHGEVKDWGRVGSAAAGGGVSGAISMAAPGVGLATRVLSNSTSSVAGGMTTRIIDSGGSSVGSVKEIATDAVVGGVTPSRGASKPKPAAKVQTKPPSTPKIQVLDSEATFQKQYRQLQAGGGSGEKPRFVSQPDGQLVDTHATPPGSYDQPGGGRTDILQREDHGAGLSHTHDPKINVNPQTGARFVNGVHQPGRSVSAEDVQNIQSGAATPSKAKGR